MTTPTPQRRPQSSLFGVYDRLIERCTRQPQLLVDGARRLLRVMGGAQAYLQAKEGDFSPDVLDLLRPELAIAIGGVLDEALEGQGALEIELLLDEAPMKIEVWPLVEGGEPFALITLIGSAPQIHKPPKRVNAPALERARIAKLERRLSYAVEREVELEERVAELEARLESEARQNFVSDALESVTEGLKAAAIFIDSLGCIKGFTSNAEALFELPPDCEGLPLRSVAAKVDRAIINQEINGALNHLSPSYRSATSLQHEDGHFLDLEVIVSGSDLCAEEALISLIFTAQEQQQAPVGTGRGHSLFYDLPLGVVQAQREGQGSIKVIEFNPSAISLGGVRVDQVRSATGEVKYVLPQTVSDNVQLSLNSSRVMQCQIKGDSEQLLDVKIVPYSRDDAVLLFDHLGKSYHDYEQKVNLQRIETVSQLTGGLAHELNNMLSVITISAEMIREELSEMSLHSENVFTILETGDQAADLVAHLLTLSKRGDSKPRVLDLNQFIESKSALIQSALGQDIPLQLYVQRQPKPVLIDRDELEQVLLQLASNAKDAIRDNGVVDIELSTANNPSIKGVTRFGEFSRITFRDNGVGMDEETIAQCFKPFFARNADRMGAGLGLSVVDKAIVKAGGLIIVNSKLNHGTTFEIYLPVADDIETQELIDSYDSQCRGKSPLEDYRTQSSEEKAPPKILIVEDDHTLRLVLVRQIEKLGYQVVDADSGEDALVLFQSTPDIDLVLSDIIMTGIRGDELARHLRNLDPEVKIILMSGYTKSSDVQSMLSDLRVPLISKPFTRQFLDQMITRVLESSVGDIVGEVTPR